MKIETFIKTYSKEYNKAFNKDEKSTFEKVSNFLFKPIYKI